MKLWFATLLATLATAPAFADTQLLVRTYQVRVQAGSFECSEPVPPNGHNYPVYTQLTFKLPSYDLWLSNVWTNVSTYNAGVNYEPCKSFPKLLRPANEQDLLGTVTQKITEGYHLSGDKRDCMRTTREEAELVVDGVKFTGVNEFLVGPMDRKLCE